jgi:hypothetical protein
VEELQALDLLESHVLEGFIFNNAAGISGNETEEGAE